jgi:hypothetical protein
MGSLTYKYQTRKQENKKTNCLLLYKTTKQIVYYYCSAMN